MIWSVACTMVLRACMHTRSLVRVTRSAYTSGLLSGGRTRVAAYVGGVFAKLWCPRAFMSWLWLFACTTSSVRKRTRVLCGACKRTRVCTHARTRAALQTRETETRSGPEPRQITTCVQLDTRNCFSIAAGDSRVPRERPTTSRFRPVIRLRERSAAQFSCFAIASARDLCLLFWCAGISVSNRLKTNGLRHFGSSEI